MATIFKSFRLPSQQIPDLVLRPPFNKPLEKDDCCSACTKEIAMPIIASLVGFVFLPVQVAIAITFVVTVGSVLYYNDCLGSSDGGSAGSKKDVKPEKATELFKRTLSSRQERGNARKPEERSELFNGLREVPVVGGQEKDGEMDADDGLSLERSMSPKELPQNRGRGEVEKHNLESNPAVAVEHSLRQQAPDVPPSDRAMSCHELLGIWRRNLLKRQHVNWAGADSVEGSPSSLARPRRDSLDSQHSSLGGPPSPRSSDLEDDVDGAGESRGVTPPSQSISLTSQRTEVKPTSASGSPPVRPKLTVSVSVPTVDPILDGPPEVFQDNPWMDL